MSRRGWNSARDVEGATARRRKDHEPVDCAVASWTAPVLWRFWLARLQRQSARGLEDWRTPKPGGGSRSSWKSISKLLGGLLGHEILRFVGTTTAFVLRHLRVGEQRARTEDFSI